MERTADAELRRAIRCSATPNTTESAEFAIGHLVKTIRLIADTLGVDRLQLLAQSRGTAVLLSALRELAIHSIAAGYEPAERLKVDNIVLMSPSIDTDMAREKLFALSADPDLIMRASRKGRCVITSARPMVAGSGCLPEAAPTVRRR